MARGLRAVTLMPKHQVPPEESKNEEEPAQNSGAKCEEDDGTNNAEGHDDSEEDEESDDQRGVGTAESPANGGANAGQGNTGNGGSPGNPEPPNDNNNNGSGDETVTGTGMPQPGYLPNGTRYSIPFYDILISMELTTANAKRMFQEDIRSADNFATNIDQEVLDRMLEKDNYGLNTLSMVKQQKLWAFHRWLHKQKTQELDLNDVNILNSFNVNAMATILAAKIHHQSGMCMNMANSTRGPKT